jgi:hypothetical protein
MPLESREMRTWELYVDDVLTLSGEFFPGPPTAVGFGWGDAASNKSMAEWDYVEFGMVRDPLDGGVNCDGAINVFDIGPFVVVLTDPDLYYFIAPDCDPMLADINGDGVVNTFDIDPFVNLLTGE